MTALFSKAAITLTLVLALAVAISGCGGGGSGSSGPVTIPPGNDNGEMPGDDSGDAGVDWPDWPVINPSYARSLVGGSALQVTSEEVTEVVNRIYDRIHNGNIDSSWLSRSMAFAFNARDGKDAGGSDLPEISVENRPVMSHNGINLAQQRSVHLDFTPTGVRVAESTHYWGWLDRVRFGVVFANFEGLYFGRIGAYANVESLVGQGAYPYNLTGNWRGAMIGRDSRDIASTPSGGALVQGDADVTVALGDAYPGAQDIDIRFSGIYEVNTGVSRPDIEWPRLTIGEYFPSIEIETEGRSMDAGFANVENVGGVLYAEEIAGVFEAEDIRGAFGVRRQ